MAYNRFSSGEDLPQFNMAVIFLERLNKRLEERDVFRVNAQLVAWYRALKTIWANIHFKVLEAGHEEEEKKVLALFDKAKQYIVAGDYKEMQDISITNLEEILDELDTIFNTLMYRYELIFPHKTEYKPKEAIRDMF